MNYSLDKIEDIFRYVANEHTITRKQFEFFCFMLQKVPKEIIDKLSNVHFVALGRRKKTACIFGIHRFRDHKAVIFLTPLALRGRWDNIAILHEVAHFELEHYESGGFDKAREEAANDLALDWFATAQEAPGPGPEGRGPAGAGRS